MPEIAVFVNFMKLVCPHVYILLSRSNVSLTLPSMPQLHTVDPTHSIYKANIIQL